VARGFRICWLEVARGGHWLEVVEGGRMSQELVVKGRRLGKLIGASRRRVVGDHWRWNPVFGCRRSPEVVSKSGSLQLEAEPFNAEPPRTTLISSYVTPVDFFYKRNHGPVPVVDDIERLLFYLQISTESTFLLTIITCLAEQLPAIYWWFGGKADGTLFGRCQEVTKIQCDVNLTTKQCAGNRRTAMSKTKAVKGVGWDVSAIGNAIWGGAKLADVLELVGITKLLRTTSFGGKHVEFVSVDMCKEEHGGPYKASIPLIHATNSEADVLLAYEMNGKPLNRDHGYPLRVIVPGVIGARSVKWLDSINIIPQECQGFFMQRDYKMFPPWVNWENIDCDDDLHLPLLHPCIQITVQGYAVSGGGRGIERVDVSFDGSKTWVEASRYQKSGIPYVSDDDAESDKWAWVLFEVAGDVSQNTEIVAKAVDSAANVQPENVAVIWNLRGILNTSWHRVQLYVKPT
ncbi:hypothetical protein C3L33_13861, partial [Rhododendron williamsianum]